MEKWRDIKDYPDYMISNLGRVKSLKFGKEKILKSCKEKNGYLYVGLCKEGKVKNYLIHRLVASAFINNSDNLLEINHIDEDKTNNRVENLEWCSRDYNTNFGTRNEKIAERRKKPILQFTKDGKLVRKWDSATQVERELNLNQSHISYCCKGKLKSAFGYKWKYYYKGIWLKKHIPLVKQKKVA